MLDTAVDTKMNGYVTTLRECVNTRAHSSHEVVVAGFPSAEVLDERIYLLKGDSERTAELGHTRLKILVLEVLEHLDLQQRR